MTLPAKSSGVSTSTAIIGSRITGEALRQPSLKPIEQGIKEALETGPLAGFPCTGVEVDLYEGSYHDVDSSEIAFKIAGSMAFQDACKRARPVLMEPVMSVEVVTPEEYMGEIIGDITSRRGRIQSMEGRGNAQVIACRVPLSEMFGYATDLRSMSQGRAEFTMQFDRYEEVPQSIAAELVSSES